MNLKRIICLILSLVIALFLVACGKENEENENKAPASSSTQGGKEEDKKVIYNVSGKEYKADMSTINVAWDEDNAPTQIMKDTFIALMKTEFGGSKITFTSENSFTLTDTNNQNHDLEATDCERIDNELFKEIATKGNVDLLIYEDKVSFLCDFFVKGWGMYISIDYVSE